MGEEEEIVSPVLVIFNTEIHCEGCGLKIERHIKKFSGVFKVAVNDESNTVKVLGNLVPEELRQHIKEKFGKEVKIVDVQSAPEKVAAAAAAAAAGGGILGWLFGRRPDSTDALNQVQLSASTAVLKTSIDCSGCREGVRKSLRAYGVKLINIDEEGGLVTVKGRVDFEKLRGYLERKLQRKVEVHSIGGDSDGGNREGGSSKKHDVGVKRVNERGESSRANENRGPRGGRNEGDGGGVKIHDGGDRKREKDGGGKDGRVPHGERKPDNKGGSGERRRRRKEEEESHGHENQTDDGD